MSYVEIIEDGIEIAEKRLKDIPDFGIYQSILKQLNYLLSILNGDKSDKGDLDKIILGHFAVREFEESDPELSEILKKCQNVAFQLSVE